MAALLFLGLLSSLSFQFCSCASPWQAMTTGSYMTPEDHDRIFLLSPDTTFSCGFHEIGTNAFTFSIWYTTVKTVVWTANPYSTVNGYYSPVNLYGSRISLNKDGNLVLTDTNGSTVWESKTSSGKHTTVSLLDTGNLVINDSGNKIVWQSFDSPTDTLLPWQKLFGESTESLLGWSQRYKIAMGTARGLAYLHHECLEWIVHCDIKPENILLTRDFNAKLADFGLAKLAKRDSASFNFTHMRGTMGYMAPEWALNMPINAKVDVYSYGVVLLEIVTGTRVSSGVIVDERQVDFPDFVQEAKQILATESITDLVDARLKGHFDPEQAIAMVRIALSCLGDRSKRPTMDKILQALMSYDDEDDHPAKIDGMCHCDNRIGRVVRGAHTRRRHWPKLNQAEGNG